MIWDGLGEKHGCAMPWLLPMVFSKVKTTHGFRKVIIFFIFSSILTRQLFSFQPFSLFFPLFFLLFPTLSLCLSFLPSFHRPSSSSPLCNCHHWWCVRSLFLISFHFLSSQSLASLYFLFYPLLCSFISSFLFFPLSLFNSRPTKPTDWPCGWLVGVCTKMFLKPIDRLTPTCCGRWQF